MYEWEKNGITNSMKQLLLINLRIQCPVKFKLVVS